MRAGVNTVQQTLTPEAAAILKHAVAEAARRGHAQATPLHVAATLLGAPGSPLRRACLQTHLHPSHPLQCRALELCFNVALDRLQAAQGPLPGGQPSYSNALVAALKRAQAHQRRGCPEQQQQPLLAVKVELEQLVISILDDPSVSRVMREAGFSSTDVKGHLEDMISVLSAHHPSLTPNNSNQSRLMLGASVDHIGIRLNASPPFLGNLPLPQHIAQYSGLGLDRSDTQLRLPPQRTSLYFNPRLQSFGGSDSALPASQDVKRVLEVMSRRKKRNPVLVGEPGLATEAVIRDLMYRIASGDVLEQLRGVKPISAQFSSLSLQTSTKKDIDSKFSGLNKVVQGFMPGGAAIHVGDLQWLLEGRGQKELAGSSTFCPVQYAVTGMVELFARHGGSGRLWLIGTASCQTYLRCQFHYPSLEGQWELQPVPITVSVRSSGLHSRYRSQEAMINVVDASLTLTLPRPHSVAPLKLSLPADDGIGKLNCCSECIAKYQQQLELLCKEEKNVQSESPQSCSSSLETSNRDIDIEKSLKPTDVVKPALPLWLQKALPGHIGNDSEVAQDKEKAVSLAQKLRELQKKWKQTCHSLHFRQVSTRSNISLEQLQQPSPFLSQASGGFTGTKAQGLCDSTRNPNGYANDVYRLGRLPGPLGHPLLSETCQPRLPATPSSQLASWKGNTAEYSQEWSASLPKENRHSTAVSIQPDTNFTVQGIYEHIPVRTDLSLGRPNSGLLTSNSLSRLCVNHQQLNIHKERIQDQSGCSPSKVGCTWQTPTTTAPATRSTGATSTDCLLDVEQHKGLKCRMFQEVDSDALKCLCKGLTERVGWQKEAISIVANTVLQCRSGIDKRHGVSPRSDTWMLFLGPDQIGKIRMAQALAELIFGCEKRIIRIKFGQHNGLTSSNILDLGSKELDGHAGTSFRGKLPLDRLAEAVKLNPFSVVLLEEVEQADSVVKGSLVQAMEKGRLSDCNGREVSFSNVIVVMTSCIGEDNVVFQNTYMEFTEKRLAGVPRVGMRLVVGDAKCEKVLYKAGLNLAVVDHHLSEDVVTVSERLLSTATSKRKVDWIEDEPGSGSEFSSNKKKNLGQALSLDLNLSVDENEVVQHFGSSGSDEAGQNKTFELIKKHVFHHASRYLKEFFDLVDAAIVFHPFDFKVLSDTVVRSLNNVFMKKFTMESSIEVDVKVFEHIIASVWVSRKKETLDDWLSETLDKSLTILLSTCNLSVTSVVKLLPDLDLVPEGCPNLPSKISVEVSTKILQEEL